MNNNLSSSSSSLYQSILIKQNEIIKDSFINHVSSNKIAIIIDPRYDSLMEGVINNFMYFMNPNGWNLLIVSYSGYAKQIKETFPFAEVKSIDDDLITLKDNIPNIDVDTYNNILLDIEFWKGLKETNICIFQKDCIMYKMFPDYFEKYDFAGANYYKREHCGFLYGGINGGFSLRNRKTMIDCLENIDWEKIVEYRKGVLLTMINELIISPYLDTKNEDVFFTIACEMLHKEVPDKLHRTFLSIEADINLETCVYHGWHYNYHDYQTAIYMLKKSDLFCKYLNP